MPRIKRPHRGRTSATKDTTGHKAAGAASAKAKGTASAQAKERSPAVFKVHQAKTQLSKILLRVSRGERVQIARGGEAPRFEVVAVPPAAVRSNTPRVFGALRGAVAVDSAFFEPLPADELKAWEG